MKNSRNFPEGNSLGRLPRGQSPLIESRQGYNPLAGIATEVAGLQRVKSWADPWKDLALAPKDLVPGTQWAPGRKTGSILAPSSEPTRYTGLSSDGVEPGHTPRPSIGRRVRMLLSFQRPSHLFRKGFLLSGAPKTRIGSRGGQMSIAPERWVAAPWSDILRRTRPGNRSARPT